MQEFNIFTSFRKRSQVTYARYLLILFFTLAVAPTPFAAAADSANVFFLTDGSSITLKRGFKFAEVESGTKNDLPMSWKRGKIIGPGIGVNHSKEWHHSVYISATTYPGIDMLYDWELEDDSKTKNSTLSENTIRAEAERFKEDISELARKNRIRVSYIAEDWVEFMGRKAWHVSIEGTMPNGRRTNYSCIIFQARGSFYSLESLFTGGKSGKWASSCIEMIADYPAALSKDPQVVASQFDLDTPTGQTAYGYALIYGTKGVIKNEVESVRWIRKAADSGHPKAQYMLGKIYEVGVTVPVDLLEAVNWIRKAADQGDARAQGFMGDCYARGRGVDRGDKLALSWWTRSAEQGYARTQYMLGLVYSNGEYGVTQNSSLAAQWYQKAAQQGFKIAERNLGLLYKAGRGVPKDAKLSEMWLSKSYVESP